MIDDTFVVGELVKFYYGDASKTYTHLRLPSVIREAYKSYAATFFACKWEKPASFDFSTYRSWNICFFDT